MRDIKTNIELKREFWSRPEHQLTPDMVEYVVGKYGEKPATMLEACFVLRERLLDLLSTLPLIRRLF